MINYDATTTNTRLAHKQMLSDMINEITSVFGGDLELEVSECDRVALEFRIEKKKKKFHLFISYSFQKMQAISKVFSFQTTHKSISDKQIVISVFRKNLKDLTIKRTFFIGRAEKQSKKTYLIDVEDGFSNLSLSKLNKKLFTPFGRQKHLDSFDDVKANYVMIHMNLYLVEESNYSIQMACSSTLQQLQWGFVESSRYIPLNDLYSYRSIKFQYSCRVNGNLYVKGNISKQSDPHKRCTFNKLSRNSIDTTWKRVVQVPQGDSKWTTCVCIY